jgi:hypothetical protein
MAQLVEFRPQIRRANRLKPRTGLTPWSRREAGWKRTVHAPRSAQGEVGGQVRNPDERNPRVVGQLMVLFPPGDGGGGKNGLQLVVVLITMHSSATMYLPHCRNR